MRKKIIAAIAAIGAAALFIALGVSLQRLLMPKYMSGVYEGRLVEEYYAEDKSHDVIFIGDCEVYENIIPLTLWENYGITSCIRGSPQQLVWQSYYLLEETLKYEKPKVVVFSVLAMKYDTPQSEAYNRLTLDGMRPSISKLRSVLASMTGGEDLITYGLPILRYHDRWRELDGDDLKYYFSGENVSHNGYMMRCDVKPVTIIPTGPKLPDYRFGQTSYEYLDKITDLCKASGVELVLLKAPSLYPYWYDEWDEQMAQYASRNNIRYLNTLTLLDEIGLDFEYDTYDAGLHLNLSGAEKTSVYLGNYLCANYDLPDQRDDARLGALWDGKADLYYGMMEAQLAEIEAFGSISTFTYRK